MTKKAFLVDSFCDYLPLVDNLEEAAPAAPAGHLLAESDFGGYMKIRIKEMPPVRFKSFLHELGTFTYGRDIINNYGNLLRDVYCDVTSIDSIKTPIIRGTAVLDLAIQYTQQEIFFPSGIRPYDDIIEHDVRCAKFITEVLLAIEGLEKLTYKIVTKFEPSAQKNISTRLLYATIAGRVIRACAYLAEWVELANITNEYGWTPKQWESFGKNTLPQELLIRKQWRPERNIIADEIKNYLFRLELEASKAISYIIAYNNLPEDILNANDAWKYEGLKWTLSIPELKSYNLKQIDAMKTNLKKARDSLQKHFGILTNTALAYPNEIYSNNPLANIMPRSAYMFFSNTINNLATAASSNFFNSSEFEGFIYKPPHSAPKNCIDSDIIAMESNVLKSNNTIMASIAELNIEHPASAKQNINSLYAECNDAVTSAIKCLGFAYMRYAAYIENNLSEYSQIFTNYIQKLIAPAVRNLVMLTTKIADLDHGDNITNTLYRGQTIQILSDKIVKIEEMIPKNNSSIQQGSVFTELATSDLLTPIRAELQLLNNNNERFCRKLQPHTI